MKRKITKLLALSLSICMAVTAGPVMAAQRYARDDRFEAVSKDNDYAEGQIIILYDSDEMSAKSRMSNIIDDNIEIADTYVFEQDNSNKNTKSVASKGELSVSLVKSEKYSTQELIDIFRKKSGVKYAEPNYKIKKSDYNDSYYKYQWAQDNRGQNNGIKDMDINADSPLLSDKDNKERVIALVDTGIDYTHEELKDVVWNNPYNNRKLYGKHGYDFINMDQDPFDDNGHGSHCSGIMAAASNNHIGISGTVKSKNIKIMGLKILDAEGYGYGMEAVGAYNYIYKAQQLGINVVAVNNSWGGTDEEESEILKTVIEMVGEKGAISVCASGNENACNDDVETIPANIDSRYVISVAASNERDELAGFSNYGKNSVDIAAPGADILSSVSYNCFNPGIYDNKFEMCSVYQDFNNSNPVNVMDVQGNTIGTVKDNEVAYGVSATDTGKMNITTTNKVYFGEQSDTDKSLQWNIEGAREGGFYYLYLPYDIGTSDTDRYASIMAKVTGPSAKNESSGDPFASSSTLFFADCKADKKGILNIGNIEDEFIAGSYIDKGNYWSHFSGKVSKKNQSEEKHALVLCVYAAVDGDFTVNIDNMGISKENVSENSFGKYDYFNGSSMAAPHVTGALASVANAYPGETMLQAKARILGSVRKSKELEDKVVTGGVLDLSGVDNPRITIEKALLNNKKQIEIRGYYTNGAKVYINNIKVDTISNDGNTIIIAGEKYINKQITVRVEKEDLALELECFFTIGKEFLKGPVITGYMDGGRLLSSGEGMIYVDDTGSVSTGIPYIDEETEKEDIEWSGDGNQFSSEIFGKEYANVVDYFIYNDTDYAYANSTLYGVLSIDVGYATDKVMAYYDNENGWKKLTNIPEDMYDLTGSVLTAYNGELYLMGGVDNNGKLSSKVKRYSISSKKWVSIANLPDGRAYSKAMQVGKKLVITLGTDGTDKIPKNIVYDGKTWRVSKAALGHSIDSYQEIVGNKIFSVSTAQIGLVKDGLIYTDFRVENLGDTFTYNLSKDAFTSTGYALKSYNLKYDNLFATTVQNKLYVIYAEQFDYEDGEEFSAMDNFNESFDYNDMEGGINSLYIPITSGFVNVTDDSSFGAYVEGAGYYLPGDVITLKAMLMDDEMVIQKFVVNGKTIAKSAKGYVYTARAYDCPSNFTAIVLADYDFGDEVIVRPAKAKISKVIRTKDNKKIKLTLKKIKKSKGYQIRYSTSKKFTKKKTKTVYSAKIKVILKKLNAKKKYYVKVRAYKKYSGKRVFGKWSKVKVIKIKK